MNKQINYNTFPRSGTMTLKTTLEKAFPDYEINFGFHLKSKIKNHIISLRNPCDSIESLIEFSFRYNQFDKNVEADTLKKRKILSFDFETGKLKYESSSLTEYDISNQIFSYSIFYCSFMEEIKKHKNQLFIISFEDLILDPNKKLKLFAEKFNLNDPLFISKSSIKQSVPKIHLPRKDSALRKNIKNQIKTSKEIKNAIKAYKEIYAIFCR